MSVSRRQILAVGATGVAGVATAIGLNQPERAIAQQPSQIQEQRTGRLSWTGDSRCLGAGRCRCDGDRHRPKYSDGSLPNGI